jgi:hypothetical protein
MLSIGSKKIKYLSTYEFDVNIVIRAHCQSDIYLDLLLPLGSILGTEVFYFDRAEALDQTADRILYQLQSKVFYGRVSCPRCTNLTFKG